MRYILSITIMLLIFSGCTNKTINIKKSDDFKNLTDKTFTYVKRDKPIQPFVMTPSKAVFFSLTGGLGGAVLGGYEYAISNDDSKKIPSYYINKNISDMLHKKYNMKYIKPNIITDSSNIDEIIKNYNNVDYLIDSQDSAWTVGYFPMHWGTYRVIYRNNLRMISTKSKKIIAQGSCEYQPEYHKTMPTYDQMFANNNKLLKKYTQIALDKCLNEFKENIF